MTISRIQAVSKHKEEGLILGSERRDITKLSEERIDSQITELQIDDVFGDLGAKITFFCLYLFRKHV